MNNVPEVSEDEIACELPPMRSCHRCFSRFPLFPLFSMYDSRENAAKSDIWNTRTLACSQSVHIR